jgi:hypothetical protein
LTKKTKLDVDRKNAQLRVEEKKKKKKERCTPNTALPPTRRKSQHTKPKAAGMRQCNRWVLSKRVEGT